VSNLHGPWLVDTVSAACSIAAVVLLLRVWKPGFQSSQRSAGCPDPQQPRLQSELPSLTGARSAFEPAAGRDVPRSASGEAHSGLTEDQNQSLLTSAATERRTSATVFQAWMPWAILTCFILVWGTPTVKRKLESIFSPKIPVAHLHNRIQRAPPVVPADAK